VIARRFAEIGFLAPMRESISVAKSRNPGVEPLGYRIIILQQATFQGAGAPLSNNFRVLTRPKQTWVTSRTFFRTYSSPGCFRLDGLGNRRLVMIAHGYATRAKGPSRLLKNPECFDKAQHERNFLNHLKGSPFVLSPSKDSEEVFQQPARLG
jgi:hypothetical protein